MKKLRIMILLIILSFSFFLMSYLKSRDYTLAYKIGKYDVTEKYIKKDKRYYVSIKYNKKNYFYIVEEKYQRKRKLVKINKFIKDEDTTCLLIKFNNKDQIPSCINNNEYISHYLVSDKFKKKINKKYFKPYKSDYKKTYKNININALYNNHILVWNYHGFYNLEKGNLKEIKLFNHDIYNVSLIGQIDKYLLIPDYNQTYEYKSFKVLNVEDLKIKNFKLNDNISSDSYVMGINDESIFYYDKKYHKEYEFVPYRLKYRDVDNYIYDKGKKKDKTEINLSNNEVEFIYDRLYEYKIINDNLYRYNKYNNYKEKITDLTIKEIVKVDDKDVYFISGESLYLYNDTYGVIKLIEYFELNFNYKNIFYIFK